MRTPTVKKRRYLDIQMYGKTYMESDKDFVLNNIEACVWFLRNRETVNCAIKTLQSEMGTIKADTVS